MLVFAGGKRDKALWNLHTHAACGAQCIIYRDLEKYSFEGDSSGDRYFLKCHPLVYLEGCGDGPSRTVEKVIADVAELLRTFGFNHVILEGRR